MDFYHSITTNFPKKNDTLMLKNKHLENEKHILHTFCHTVQKQSFFTILISLSYNLIVPLRGTK